MLRRRQTTVANRFEEISETSDLTAPTPGSPSDSEPNPFLETTADLSGPIIPGRFRLTASPVISEEMVWKVEPGPDVESLQQEIDVLKTMYKQQERGREKHKRSVQGAIDGIRMLL